MSWAEVYKINSDMSTPLDKLIKLLLVGGYAWSIETGSHSFTVPSGLDSVYISAIAAGGGGSGGCAAGTGGFASGGGGGRGEYLLDAKTNIASSTIAFNLGANGTGGAGNRQNSSALNVYSGAGTNAGDLSINNGNILLAGGKGAGAAACNVSSSSPYIWGGTGGTIGGGNGTTASSPGSISGGAGGKYATFHTYGYGSGGDGGSVSEYGGSGTCNPGTNGKKGIIIVTWGAIRFSDVIDAIQLAIAGGATHGEG